MLTNYNPSDKKFKERDRTIIEEESRASQLFREDKHTARIGKLEEELDWQREQK